MFMIFATYNLGLPWPQLSQRPVTAVVSAIVRQLATVAPQDPWINTGIHRSRWQFFNVEDLTHSMARRK